MRQQMVEDGIYCPTCIENTCTASFVDLIPDALLRCVFDPIIFLYPATATAIVSLCQVPAVFVKVITSYVGQPSGTTDSRDGTDGHSCPIRPPGDNGCRKCYTGRR